MVEKLVLEVCNAPGANLEQHRMVLMFQITPVTHVLKDNLQKPEHEVVQNVLVVFRKIKQVKQGVLNAFLEESIITMVTKIALNVL